MTAAANNAHAAYLVRGLNESISRRGLWGYEQHTKAVVVDGGIEVSHRGRWLITLNPEAFATPVELHMMIFHMMRACTNFALAERAA